jgi:RND family efflux transporter MFP subunit
MKTVQKLIPAAGGLVAIAAIAAFASASQKNPLAAAAPPPADAPATVVLAPVEERNIPNYLLLTGELKADQESLVAADAAGKVTACPIERGSKVARGDTLVQLDSRAAQLALREAEAMVALAKARSELARGDLDRNEPLVKTKAIAEADFQRFHAESQARQADLQAALVRLDAARKNLGDMTIAAPFSGIISERLVQAGEYVRLETGVARLVAMDRLRLELHVPEPVVAKVAAGRPVAFGVSAHPETTFSGKIKHVGAAVREASRDLVIEAEVDNRDLRLRPGMFASARLLLEDAPGLAVPKSALRRDDAACKVLVVQNGRLAERLVDVGEMAGDWVHIRHGLAKGEKVVLNPSRELKNGRPVQL